MTTVADAKVYVQNNMSIFPLDGKRPAINWKAYQRRIASEKQVGLWWGIYRGANIGLATGAISGLFILDIDHDADNILEKATPVIDKFVPKYHVSMTGKGYHIWVPCKDAEKTSNTIVARTNDKKVYIETRGQGGYIVAPPSIHQKSKKKYQFIQGKAETFHDLPSVSSNTVDALLKCLHDELNEYTPPPITLQKNTIVDGRTTVTNRESYIEAILKKQVSLVKMAGSGERNRVLFQAAANLGAYATYIDAGTIFDELMNACESNGLIHDDGKGSAAKTIASGLRKSSQITVEENPFAELGLF